MLDIHFVPTHSLLSPLWVQMQAGGIASMSHAYTALNWEKCPLGQRPPTVPSHLPNAHQAICVTWELVAQQDCQCCLNSRLWPW
jgi:hypothetical protein